jgi:hypothetical protein
MHCNIVSREGRLEEKLCQAIFKTFENQGTRDSVCQLRWYYMNERRFGPDFGYSIAGVHLLHLVSMHGLQILCGNILRQSNTMQRMYFLAYKPLI